MMILSNLWNMAPFTGSRAGSIQNNKQTKIFSEESKLYFFSTFSPFQLYIRVLLYFLSVHSFNWECISDHTALTRISHTDLLIWRLANQFNCGIQDKSSGGIYVRGCMILLYPDDFFPCAIGTIYVVHKMCSSWRNTYALTRDTRCVHCTGFRPNKIDHIEH